MMSANTKSQGMAIASLVLGMLSMVRFGLLTGLPAIILGHIACGRTRKAPEQYGGSVQVLSNELVTPKLLVCPADSSKQAALGFQELNAANVSYQVRSGTNVNPANPQEVLAVCPVHGHEVLCDGSVQQGRR